MNLIDRIYAHNKEVSSSDYTSNYNSVLNRFMIWVSGGLWDDYILSCISDVKDTYSVMLLNAHHNPYRNGKRKYDYLITNKYDNDELYIIKFYSIEGYSTIHLDSFSPVEKYEKIVIDYRPK
jgi:hypothetical protein